MMRPDDRALDVGCPRCKAMVGEPCTKTVSNRELLELEYAHAERRSAVAASGLSASGFAPPATAMQDGPDAGVAEGRPFDRSTETPLPGQPVDGTITRAADVPAALGLPLVELECGNPASTREAIKALQNPNADIFCWFHGKYEKRRAS